MPNHHVRFTHPDRVLYPDQGLTKRHLADYYIAIADWILPHLKDRPLSLVRCPRGRDEPCFYQKHLGDSAPPELRQVQVPEKKDKQLYAVADDPSSLVALVQLGVLEIHPWLARADRLDAPDQVIFDLDPGPQTHWSDVVEAGRLFQQALDYLNLTGFCKLTGGKGLHVVVPIARRHDWKHVKAFAKALAEQVAASDPDQYTTNMAKRARPGKIYIDYVRNTRGATAIAPYSTRARPGAPVATPIAWNELTPQTLSNHYTVANLPARLRSLHNDPWEQMANVRQSLTKKIMQNVGL